MTITQFPTDKLVIWKWDPRIEPKNDNDKRRREREYQQLKRSISIDGILVPLMTVKKGDSFEVIAGRNRLRAAKELGIQTVPIRVHDDIDTKVKKIRASGSENAIRSNGDDESLSKWVFAMYEAEGYDAEEAMLGAKAIDNWFSHNTNNKTNWDEFNKVHNSVMHLRGNQGSKTNPILLDKHFTSICQSVPYTPKYQYQLMSILVKLDDSVRDKAQRKGLSTNKQISLTTSPLPEHPKIQKELIDEIAEMPTDIAKERVQEVASQLNTGRIRKQGTRYIVDGEIPKEDNKVLPPINLRIMDIAAAVNRYLFVLTQRAITKGEHEMSEEFIRNTKQYRLEILKTLDERNLVNLEKGLRLVQLVTNEMLRLIEREFETVEQKKELMRK